MKAVGVILSSSFCPLVLVSVAETASVLITSPATYSGNPSSYELYFMCFSHL